MKKLLLSMVALLVMSLSANAGTIVGSEDNSTGWWTAFSDYYSLKGDGSVVIKFTNYSDKANNWDNWLCVCTNDVDRAATGYSENFVMRVDNYGWGSDWNTSANPEKGTLASNYNWDTFKEDMDGSTVCITLIRKGDTVKMRANITTTAGTSYYETWEQTITDLSETIRFFLATEKGHLDIESADVNNANYVALGSTGTYTATGWEAQNYFDLVKDAYTEVYDDRVIVRDFCGATGYDICVYSNTDGVTKITQIVNGEERERAYYGYDYVMSGLTEPSVTDFGIYPTGGYSSSWEEEGKINTGALLLYSYAYYGDADQTGTRGYYYFGWGDNNPSAGIGMIKASTADVKGATYNIAGQRMSANAKGLLIKNGKKVVVK